jgi:hypothetical protein
MKRAWYIPLFSKIRAQSRGRGAGNGSGGAFYTKQKFKQDSDMIKVKGFPHRFYLA